MTARARAGYAMDRALLYVTGGYAGAEDTINVPGMHLFDRLAQRRRDRRGIEYAFTNNISAKAEYIYAPFDDKSYISGDEERPRHLARPRRPELQVLIGSTAQAAKARRGNPPGFFVSAPYAEVVGLGRDSWRRAPQFRMFIPPFAAATSSARRRWASPCVE